ALVNECTDNCIHIVVSASNDHKNACLQTPAAAPSAIMVGTSDRLDKMAGLLNYGPCVDIYAPGIQILLAFIRNDTDSWFLDRTSMSTPHVVAQ
ncbi:39757_t:CDS:2, partial [Gigaspora margarita]